MKVLYFDMDNVLVDFQSGIDQLTPEELKEYEGRLDDVPHIFSKMKPLKGSQEAVEVLSKHFDCYILSTSPWANPTAASDKQNWIKKYYPEIFHKRMILSHRKDFLKGDYLIDDRDAHGAPDFEGEWIYFKSDRFPNWEKVVQYILGKEKIRTTDFNMDNFYRSMMDFEDENEDYATLYNSYLNTEIYNEIRGFLDIAHPEWRKNKNLGKWAPEFILSIINMWEDREEDETYKDWLKTLYEETDSDYSSYCSDYQSVRSNELEREFQQEFGYVEDYDTYEEYEEAYKVYKLKNDEEEYWMF
jgi:5'(3')-deoxyribonucleotidase